MYASAAVQAEMLPQLVTPGNLGAFAISEPNAGSDAGAAQTRAERTTGGWKLHGSKMWVTNGITGRWFCVLAIPSHYVLPPGESEPPEGGQADASNANGVADAAGRAATKRRLSMFLLDAEQPRVKRSPIHGKMGIRASETAEMSLDGAFVPEAHLLGQFGWGMRIGLSALDGGRIGIASQAVGIGQAALDLMVGYAEQREVFGRKIADFQAIQWMIADSHAELMAAQRLIDRAAWLKEEGRSFTQAASMAKLYASEAANRIAYRAVQSHGGYGFVREFRVEQLYRDARITTIYEGTSEIQRHVIARNLLRDAT
jgi:alkylation response protein AidB-like acyl-CoA dehydrogenase